MEVEERYKKNIEITKKLLKDRSYILHYIL